MPKPRPADPAPSKEPLQERGVHSGPLSPEEERQALLSTLQRLGFLPAVKPGPSTWSDADLWVRHSRGHSLLPVLVEAGAASSSEERTRALVERWSSGFRSSGTPAVPPSTSILVVDSDVSAELTGKGLVASSPVPLAVAVARTRILVQPRRAGENAPPAHWHRLQVPPKVVLMLATGTLIGLAQRSQRRGGEEEGGIPLDLEGMFRELRATFSIDIEGSLGVTREEDAMFLLYQLALKETYAPGDQGASLHELVHNPKGPAARLPWFAI